MKMEDRFKRTIVTCALPYANGPVHIGHVAGCYLPGDIYVRYLRLRGEDVVFICGSDEHGVPITIKAREQGVSPQDIVDKYHKIMKDAFTGIGFNFDIYSRTTSKVHGKNASEFFRKLYDDGKFVTQESEQYFDPQAKVFLADRYITGTCPRCGNPNAYGDQCEKCGSTLSPEELKDPHSALSGAAPVKVKTKHWYLPLNEYEPWLREWILEQHKEWKSNVYGQCKSWLDGHLQPRAVTRDLDWGIPVPVEGAEGKVLYVWFDAPLGYVSNTQELLPKDWEKWWRSDDSRLVHFIGKDNIVFHCIVFPSMLKSYGGYVLPDNVPANEFLNLENDKISTSRNWAVWLHEYLKEFNGQQDVLRYVLCANAPEGKDNDFTWKDFQTRNNTELVAIFGNFVNRAVVLTQKYFGGVVPADEAPEPIDAETLASLIPCKESLEKNLETFHFKAALADAMNIARIGNKYISDMAPWSTAKTDMARTASILHVCLQICGWLSVVFEPFLPFSAEKLRGFLRVGLDAGTDHRLGDGSVPSSEFGVKGTAGENFYRLDEGCALHTRHAGEAAPSGGIVLSWKSLGEGADLLPAGHELGKAELLFAKIEDSVVEAQMARLAAIKKANEAAAAEKAAAEAREHVEPLKAEASFDDFTKLDIRTATILTAERVPKTDKLLKFTLDTGLDKRTIVSGIAKWYAPEDLVGKQVCILANLAPKTLRGIESRGMILTAEQGDGSLSVITPSSNVANGSQVL